MSLMTALYSSFFMTMLCSFLLIAEFVHCRNCSAPSVPSRASTSRTTARLARARGFAFVNFVHREDAARAVAKLDGHGYDNLILRVEFAAPRAERA